MNIGALTSGITSGFSAIPLDLAATNGAAAPTKASAKSAGQSSAQTALFQKIQQSVLSALQSADSSNSNADPNQIIQQAIAGVFQQSNSNGISSPQSSSNNAESPQTFFETLQQYGISPQDFRNDYASALKSSQNGLSPANSLFGGSATGSLIDVTV
jgi:murein L,D-transpeptidase YcbB/YkuD